MDGETGAAVESSQNKLRGLNHLQDFLMPKVVSLSGGSQDDAEGQHKGQGTVHKEERHPHLQRFQCRGSQSAGLTGGPLDNTEGKHVGQLPVQWVEQYFHLRSG